MMSFEVPGTSKVELEKIAESELLEFDPEMLETPKALNVERLLDLHMKKKYGWSCDPQRKDLLPTSAEAYSDPKSRTVVLPEETHQALDNDGRARFTACHEYAHVVKHRLFMMMRMVALSEQAALAFRKKRMELPAYKCAEWQADYLAGALLMPKKHILKIWQNSYGLEGLAIRVIMRIFLVSYTAAKKRLSHVCR